MFLAQQSINPDLFFVCVGTEDNPMPVFSGSREDCEAYVEARIEATE